MSSKRPKRSPLSVAQMLMVGFRPEEEADILGWVEEGSLGGVILFGRNGKHTMEVARLCRDLREAARTGKTGSFPIVAVDQEQGRICRIEEGITRFPGAAVLGRLNRPRTTQRVAGWVAEELSAVGVNLNLAPVADVLTTRPPPEVLEGRAFGSDPFQVARHVRSWIRGSQGASLAACAKHFPGHGAVQEDSHVRLPRDSTPLRQIQSSHLIPFSSAIRIGVASIMIGHLAFEALDPALPASLSPHVIRDLLRKQMGFEGLVLTDDLEMKAVTERWDPLSAAIKAIKAGTDMALVGRHIKGDVSTRDLITGLDWAMRRGLLPKDGVAASIHRVTTFRRSWIPSRWTPPAYPPLSSAAQRLAKRLAVEGGDS